MDSEKGLWSSYQENTCEAENCRSISAQPKVPLIEGYKHPARRSFSERGSLRKIALAMPVKIGVRNVRAVASDRDRYRSE